jgi:hypothetical protein
VTACAEQLVNVEVVQWSSEFSFIAFDRAEIAAKSSEPLKTCVHFYTFTVVMAGDTKRRDPSIDDQPGLSASVSPDSWPSFITHSVTST